MRNTHQDIDLLGCRRRSAVICRRRTTCSLQVANVDMLRVIHNLSNLTDLLAQANPLVCALVRAANAERKNGVYVTAC